MVFISKCLASRLRLPFTVTVRGNRNRDAKRFEMKTIQVRWADKRFDVYPERE